MPQVLLLNNDNQPLQYTSWKRAVVLLLKGKAEVEEKIKRIEDYIKVGKKADSISTLLKFLRR